MKKAGKGTFHTDLIIIEHRNYSATCLKEGYDSCRVYIDIESIPYADTVLFRLVLNPTFI